MKKEIIQLSKTLILGLILSAGLSFAGTQTAPPSPPFSNNPDTPINVSAFPQAKGGLVTTGSLLNINGLLSSNSLAIFGNATILGNGNLNNGTIRVDSLSLAKNLSLAVANYPAPVCTDTDGKLTVIGCTTPPPPTTYTLTVQNPGAGFYVGSSLPNQNIKCGNGQTACTDIYPISPVTQVKLQSNASTSKPIDWVVTPSGNAGNDCSSTTAANCTITMNSNTTVILAPVQPVTLTVIPAGVGVSVSDDTISSYQHIKNCSSYLSNCTGYYLPGESITLDVGFYSDAAPITWSGDCTGIVESCGAIVMNGNKTVTATGSKDRMLKVVKAGTGLGTVTSTSNPNNINSPSQINCGSTCTIQIVKYKYPGATVVLTATPASGSTFTGWNVAGGQAQGCSGIGPCTVVTTGGSAVTATFN